MLKAVAKDIHASNPKFNEKLLNGLTKTALDQGPAMIDLIWREGVSSSLPKGLIYERAEICLPEEVMKVLTSPTNKDNKLEMTRTDFILVKFILSWTPEDSAVKENLPPIYIPLPFCDEYGLTTIRGVVNHIAHVVSDKVFSRVDRGLFIPFNKDRLTFERTPFAFKLSGQPIETFITYSNIHAFSKQAKNKAGANPAIVTYLYSKYGLYETLAKFTGVTRNEFVVGSSSDITVENYPPEEWYIAESYKFKLKGFNDKVPVGFFDVAIAVKKESYDNIKLMTDFIAGFFYSIEYYPSKVKLNWIEDKNLWATILAEIIYQDTISDSKKVSAVNNHIDSLSHYVDKIMVDKLELIGCDAKDIFELSVYILENIDKLYITIDPASMDHKRIDTIQYVSIDTVKKLNRFAYSVFKQTGRPLDKKAITQRISNNIPRSTMLEVERHGEVSPASFVGDNAIFKYLTAMVSQVDATASGKSKKVINDPGQKFHPSAMGINSHLCQTKPQPTGKSKLNPMVIIDDFGGISYPEVLNEVFDDILTYIRS